MAIRQDINLFEGGGDDTGGGGAKVFIPLQAGPLPTISAPAVSGGATPATDATIQEFATEAGGFLACAYGEHLIAGHLTTHKYVPATPASTFVVALGEGWGSGGKHGEWEGVVKIYYAGEEVPAAYDYRIWIEDAVPDGATQVAGADGWNWVDNNPTPYFGRYSHKSILQAGHHQHHFENATASLVLGFGNTLYCFVFLDPTNPPQEVMLAWAIGADFEHRAYWGANLLPFGINGTNSRRSMGALPGTGAWVRLDVPASLVGLDGATINGMAFALFDGIASYDQAGYWRPTTTAGYNFRRGIVPTDIQDIQHSGAISLSAGLAHSGTADVIMILTTAQASEDRPDKFRGRFKCRRTYDFNAAGTEIGYGYSANPARVAADVVLNFFERLFPDDNALAREKFQERIDWPAWRAWADYNDTLIPWNRDGSGNVNIPRFEAHIAFTEGLILADALDRICAMCAAWWQDDGEKIIFLPPIERDPIHHFDESNIMSAPQMIPRDLRERPNRFIATVRDFDDEFLGEETSENPVRREESIRKVGEIKSERVFSNMRLSQAQRLLERQARLEHDNATNCTLVGDETSIHVLPGDFVTVSHPLLNWEYQRCLVVDIEVRSAEEGADHVSCTLQAINGALYSDTDHTPIQPELTP